MRIKTEINDSRWFGNIPDGWSMVPLPRLFSISKGMTVTKADLVDVGAPVVNYAQVHSKENNKFGISHELIKHVPEDYVPKGLRKSTLGSFIFACTSEDLTGCGDCIYNDSEQALNPGGDTLLLSPISKVDNKYFAYLFSTDMWRWQLRRDLVDVKVFHVNQGNLREAYVVVPPRSVRCHIVSYLDERCAAIDDDAAKRREVIGKLREYKKSLIAHAVTKGLDPDAEMKDSGVEWLGAVPAEWRLTKIGQVYDLRNKKVSDVDFEPLSVTMQGIVPQLSNAAKTDAHDDRKLVMKGDFVINSRSDRRGSCGIAKQNGSVSLINTVLIPRDSMEPRFYDWLFHTSLFADEFYRNGRGIVDDLWTTKWTEMKGITIVEPPIEEQIRIADYLDERCSAIDEAVARQEQLIDKLDEYRKSIIHHAVTGKIDCTEG